MMLLLLGSGDSGLVQVVVLAVIGVIWVLGKLVHKASQQQRGEGTRTMTTMGQQAQPPTQAQVPERAPTGALAEVRRFFEALQSGQQSQQGTAQQPVPEIHRRRQVARAVPLAAPEEPTPKRKVSLAERMKRREAQEQGTTRAAAVKHEPVPTRGLERLVGNVRMSPAARAIVSGEIMGSPRSLSPYRTLSDG